MFVYFTPLCFNICWCIIFKNTNNCNVCNNENNLLCKLSCKLQGAAKNAPGRKLKFLKINKCIGDDTRSSRLTPDCIRTDEQTNEQTNRRTSTLRKASAFANGAYVHRVTFSPHPVHVQLIYAVWRRTKRYRLCFNSFESRGNCSVTSNNMKVDGWAVTFGTAMRGLGGAPARPGPSSPDRM